MSNKLCNKLSNKVPSYLITRNHVYYFCYRLPKAISPDKPQIIRYSLRTKSPDIARLRMAKLLELVHASKEKISDRSARKLSDDMMESIKGRCFISEGMQEVDDADLELKQLQLKCFKKLSEKCDDYINAFSSEMDSLTDDERAARLRVSNRIASYTMTDKGDNQKTLINEVINSLTNTDYQSNFTGMYEYSQQYKEDFEKYGQNYLRKKLGFLQEVGWLGTELQTAYNNNDPVRLDSIVSRVNSNYTRLLTELDSQRKVAHISEPVEPDLPKISEFIPEFLAWDEDGRNRSDKVVSAYRRELDFLLATVGDKPVNRVTRQDIKESINIKRKMPKRHTLPYKNWSIADTVEKIQSGYEVEDDDLIASKTAKDTMKCYQSFFSSFLFKHKDVLEKAPTEGIEVSYSSESYANYSDKQMELILEHYKSLPESDKKVHDKKMVTLAACYTGMRLSEICKLTSDRIRYDEESGYHYIFIQKGKTDAARRIVPLCKKLEELGFVAYVKALDKNQCLYSKKSDLITDYLKSVRDKLKIPHQNEYEQRLVFHSFRHTVITKARENQVSDPVLQRVVGHATSKSITDKYSHEYSVKNLTCVVECLPW